KNVIERARRNEVGDRLTVLAYPINPNSAKWSCKKRLQKAQSTTGRSFVAAGTTCLAFDNVRLQAFGVRPRAPGSPDRDSVMVDLVNYESLPVPAVAIGMCVKSGGEFYRGAARSCLEIPKQPCPFVMVPWFGNTAARIRKGAQLRSKILAKSTCIRLKEAHG